MTFAKGIKVEVMAGITTFLAMACILALNPAILASTGMDKGGVFTATALSAAVATLVMSIYGKLPFGLAPGMGLNTFFACTICGTMGYPWQFALTAVFIEGIIFILLTATGIREYIVNAIPTVLQNALPPGIGMFLALLGLNGAGIIATPTASLPVLGDLTSPSAMLTLFGILITTIMLLRQMSGALLFGIIITAIVGIPFDITHMTGVVNIPPSVSKVAMQFQWDNIFSVDMLVCVLTLLFMDMFDTIGSVIGVCSSAGMIDKDSNVPHLKKAFMADAIGTTVGAMLGTSTVTTFVASAAGVKAGGRSGLTSFVTALCFLLALFLSPLFLAIPSQATASAVFLVGAMMMQSITKIDFSDMSNAIPCFVCIFVIPMTSSIPNGLMLGLVSYVVINAIMGKWDKLNIGMYILTLLFIAKYIFL